MKKFIATLSAISLLSGISIASAAQRTVTESQAGKTIKVSARDKIELTLSSSYWELTPLDPKRAVVSEPITTAILPGQNKDPKCQVMGSGCATKVWNISFLKTGKFSISATRTICGEAMHCSAKDGKISFLFKVSK